MMLRSFTPDTIPIDDDASSAPVAIDFNDVDAVRAFVTSEMRSTTLPGHLEQGCDAKAAIRLSHQNQRRERGKKELRSLGSKVPVLLNQFANGCEVNPERISPRLELVESGSQSNNVFRVATLLWSVPVSKGYGRRMRYIVRDDFNGKVIGIFALGDPVFNLRTRDRWIGWNVQQRVSRLTHVMDAYIVGAVPPYSQILGGKLVASLVGTDQVRENFRLKYEGRTGIISEQTKPAQLGLVTVTSALGRSSIYNRLRLLGLVDLQPIGYTEGWGHFQISDSAFEVLRAFLEAQGHRYANGHRFGNGPNWKIRTIREALSAIGLDPDILRHGIKREVYAMPLCQEVQSFLCGTESYRPTTPTVDEMAEAAKSRWVIPRSLRYPGYRNWNRRQLEQQLWDSITAQLTLPLR